MKLVVYTALLGNYDKLKELKFRKQNVDYICFTDQKKLRSKTWKITYLETSNKTATDINRDIKINVLDHLKVYDKSIYIDGNIAVLSDLEQFFDRLDNYPMAALKHRTRSCIFREAEECLRIGKSNGNEILNQVNEYKKEGFPENFGMTENCILIRDHNHPELKTIISNWWDSYLNGVKRDQISLPYLTWRYNLNIKPLEFNPRDPNPYLRWRQHDSRYKGIKRLKYRIKYFLDSKNWRKITSDELT